MDADDDLFGVSSRDFDSGTAPSKPSRFQPKMKGKGKVKVKPEPSLDPSLTQPMSESIPHSHEAEPSNDPLLAHSNGATASEIEAEGSSMDVEEEEEDVVVQEFDVYLNPNLDSDTKLYGMQYPLRPSWRPYEMNERCNEVRIKPKLSKFEIELNLDVDSDKNYNKHGDDTATLITTQILSSSSKPFVNEFAVGFLRGNRFHVIPLHTIVQFRPSKNCTRGIQKTSQESSSKLAENPKESLKIPIKKENASQSDAKTNEHIDIDEPWVELEYHASGSSSSCSYLENALADQTSYIPLAMKSSDYLYSYGLTSSGSIKKSNGPSIRCLLMKPLEDRLKQWLSEGPQINHFNALLHLTPTDSIEDVLKLLQEHAYLVQGLWVSKSSLLHNGLSALYRDFILLQFSKGHAILDSKLKAVRPDDLKRTLLKPLAVERSMFKDWKFKEATDISFIKKYPEIVKEQENAWSFREKEIMDALPAGGKNILSMMKNSVAQGSSSKAVGLAEPAHLRDRKDAKSSVVTKSQETLAKAILELLRLYRVLSLNSIIQGLQGKINAGLPEVEGVADQIALKIHDIYVLKSLGKPELDQFRNVVFEYFIGKGRNAKVKKQEIKLAAQYRLKREVSDADYNQAMNELCMYSGGSWVLKTGALK